MEHKAAVGHKNPLTHHNRVVLLGIKIFTFKNKWKYFHIQYQTCQVKHAGNTWFFGLILSIGNSLCLDQNAVLFQSSCMAVLSTVKLNIWVLPCIPSTTTGDIHHLNIGQSWKIMVLAQLQAVTSVYKDSHWNNDQNKTTHSLLNNYICYIVHWPLYSNYWN